MRDSIPERVAPGIHTREDERIREARSRGTRNGLGTRANVPELREALAPFLRPFPLRFPRALLFPPTFLSRSHRGGTAKAAPRVRGHRRLRWRSARRPRRARSAAGSVGEARSRSGPRARGDGSRPTNQSEDEGERTRYDGITFGYRFPSFKNARPYPAVKSGFSRPHTRSSARADNFTIPPIETAKTPAISDEPRRRGARAPRAELGTRKRPSRCYEL